MISQELILIRAPHQFDHSDDQRQALSDRGGLRVDASGRTPSPRLPDGLDGATVMRLQRGAGNAAVARFLASAGSPATLMRQRRESAAADAEREQRTTEMAEGDTRMRRRPGGRGRGRRKESLFADLDNDWAGKALLERYLSGEGDWDISNAKWASYMKRNELLRDQLLPRIASVADDVARSGVEIATPFRRQFAAEIENGEGIVGYAYLHGTNADVGGFVIDGVVTPRYTHRTPREDGSASGHGTMSIHATYTWNDMIDPNPGYWTDSVKSFFAELLTLGSAEGYRVSITWEGHCEVDFTTTGIGDLRGYPGEGL